jgi:hypothetical protein
VVHLQGTFDPFFKELFQLLGFQQFLKALNQVIMLHGPVGTAIGAEALLNLIAPDLFFHIIEESPLTSFHVFHPDFVGMTPGGFLLHSFLYPFAYEERHSG